ncbi:hypothetical protein C8J57DRAFT_717198 [Mycena rebaudengoi]|nr:hypothetical protein C8J57DRAFT_758243 [Mycena rebaudengoi]KAJ7248402.1 hypothetical protein C8J57DRAFT_717198 [Mycena rebaudengoi]
MHPTACVRKWYEYERGGYLDRNEVKASYWKNGRMSPGLLRARRQYRTKNAVVGIALFAFVAGVFSYSMAAVKQDVFEDMDEEARERAILEARRSALTVDDEKRAMTAAASSIKGPKLADRTRALAMTTPAESRPGDNTAPPRGVLATLLGERYPWLLDPNQKTLVWGAPPVDKVGSLRDPPHRGE